MRAWWLVAMAVGLVGCATPPRVAEWSGDEGSGMVTINLAAAQQAPDASQVASAMNQAERQCGGPVHVTKEGTTTKNAGVAGGGTYEYLVYFWKFRCIRDMGREAHASP